MVPVNTLTEGVQRIQNNELTLGMQWAKEKSR